MTRQMLLQKIREASFAVNEAVLYLDTHPNNKKALRYFDRMRNTLNAFTAEYAESYGPVKADECDISKGWQWVSDKWPWESEGGNG